MKPLRTGLTPESREIAVFQNDLRDLGVGTTKEAVRNLLFLAERKYNRYDLYAPGETFPQRLVDWLSNFDAVDRNAAMDVVRELRFFNQNEMRALAAATLQNVVTAIQSDGMSLSRASAISYMDTLQSQTEMAVADSLFIAMADDVLFDFFRRNAQRQFPVLRRGNFVEYYKLNPEDVSDLEEYSRVFLLDQISGSSLSFLRREDENWKGKLPTFFEIWGGHVKSNEAKVHYLPFIMSTVAERTLSSNLDPWNASANSGNSITVTPTQMVPVASCLSTDGGSSVDETTRVASLCDKYYHLFKENIHHKVGGGCKYGVGSAGLILVLYTNCPNDSLYLIWHKNNGWRPLFERVEHHRE